MLVVPWEGSQFFLNSPAQDAGSSSSATAPASINMPFRSEATFRQVYEFAAQQLGTDIHDIVVVCHGKVIDYHATGARTFSDCDVEPEGVLHIVRRVRGVSRLPIAFKEAGHWKSLTSIDPYSVSVLEDVRKHLTRYSPSLIMSDYVFLDDFGGRCDMHQESHTSVWSMLTTIEFDRRYVSSLCVEFIEGGQFAPIQKQTRPC
jgi:hypothetical protein